MVVIRLTRVGKKKQPSYRMVVQEKGRDPWGDYIELVGHYNPLVHPAELTLKEDRIAHWIGKGAQPSDTVWNLLVDRGIVKGEKRRIVQISNKKRAKAAPAPAAKAG
ncbi:30S ribosomal protein S16 [Candidatus Uhrbacteria bacterium]|nr:30S ribosomal protein S16 [Candidatus Uhrbacteria bacterium]